MLSHFIRGGVYISVGVIPDAATIHAIRKKRQMAREQGDFIPLDDTQKVHEFCIYSVYY